MLTHSMQGPEVEAPAPYRKPSRGVRVCSLCGTSETPKWRKSADRQQVFCNACGLQKFKQRSKGDGSDTSPQSADKASAAAPAPPPPKPPTPSPRGKPLRPLAVTTTTTTTTVAQAGSMPFPQPGYEGGGFVYGGPGYVPPFAYSPLSGGGLGVAPRPGGPSPRGKTFFSDPAPVADPKRQRTDVVVTPDELSAAQSLTGLDVLTLVATSM